MSRDGLIEQNVSTNEEVRVSMRNIEFDLKGSDSGQALPDNARSVHTKSNSATLSRFGKMSAGGTIDSASADKRRKYRAFRNYNDSVKQDVDAGQSRSDQQDLQNQERQVSHEEHILPVGTHSDTPAASPKFTDTEHPTAITQHSKLKHEAASHQHEKPAPLQHERQHESPSLTKQGYASDTTERSAKPRKHHKYKELHHLVPDSKPKDISFDAFKTEADGSYSSRVELAETSANQKLRDGPISSLQADKPGKLRFLDDEVAVDSANTKDDAQAKFHQHKLTNKLSEQSKSHDRLEHNSDAPDMLPDYDNPTPLTDESTAANPLGETSAQQLQPPKQPANRKLAKAERVFDEDTGKGKCKLHFEKEAKPLGKHMKEPLPLRPVKFGVNSAIAKAHMKVFQVEHENVSVKVGHKAELAGEGVIRAGLRYRKNRPYAKVAKLEKEVAKKSANLAYQKALAEYPKLNSSILSRMWQKQKIKRQYAKQARAAQTAQTAAAKTGLATRKVLKLALAVIKSNPKLWAIVLVVGLTVFLFTSCVNLISSIGSGASGAIFATTYLAGESDIDNAALAYSEWEADLLTQIDNVQGEFPGFDEYRFNVDMIAHNPLELLAYLTAVHFNFTYPEILDALRELFDEQYQLTFTESVEIRHYEDEDGNLIPYEWRVLTTTLTARSLTEVIHGRLSPDQRQHFDLLMRTSGQRQIVGSPFEHNWLPFVTSHYGWRVHPISGARELHRGIDIGRPTGTPILAAHDGVITFAGSMGGYGNVVFISGDNGIETRYAHCDTILVTVGQQVSMGDVIATVGSTGDSTGPHLHFEILRNGQHLNPIFFAQTNSDPTADTGPIFGDPGAPIGDGTFEAMLAEATRLVGAPYVFGASGPNSFDCSGFVWWVLTRSGAADVGRTSSQGFYNMSRPVSPNDARPGDLVFFHSTFSSPNFITHIGIYLGGGQMFHTGSNPNGVEIVNITTPRWQSHFHAFGRLSG